MEICSALSLHNCIGAQNEKPVPVPSDDVDPDGVLPRFVRSATAAPAA
jgi:hypothetical protein